MRIKNIELWAAALCIMTVTAGYLLLISRSAVPAASSLFGHGLGIVGFILMLMTETLYSLRKRYQFARWGKLENWLSFHIFTGLVGPFLVLLHTSWKFQGLAGVLTLMTLIIVISGFIGRYFYTAIPRTVEGSALEANQIQALADHNLGNILSWQKKHLGQAYENEGEDYRQALNHPDLDQNAANQLRELVKQRDALNSQLTRFERTRKILAVWHAIHVPLALSVFLVALVHILAALYYSTLLR